MTEKIISINPEKVKGFYVYLHRKASNNDIFYVGKGKGKRAWDVGKGRRKNNHWQNVADKHGVVVEIACDGMTEDDSLLLEMWLIAKLRHEGVALTNLTDGGDGTTGFVHSEDNLAKMSAVQSGKKNPRYLRKVHMFYHPEHGIYMGTMFDFKVKYELPGTNIRRLMNDRTKTCRGWRYGGESSLSEPKP